MQFPRITQIAFMMILCLLPSLQAHEIQGTIACGDDDTWPFMRSPLPDDTVQKEDGGRLYMLWLAPTQGIAFYIEKPLDNFKLNTAKPDTRFRVWFIISKGEKSLPPDFIKSNNDKKGQMEGVEELIGLMEIDWHGDANYSISLDVKGLKKPYSFKGDLFGNSNNKPIHPDSPWRKDRRTVARMEYGFDTASERSQGSPKDEEIIRKLNLPAEPKILTLRWGAADAVIGKAVTAGDETTSITFYVIYTRAGSTWEINKIAGMTASAKRNWADNCASCHGIDGRGDTDFGRKNKLRDLTTKKNNDIVGDIDGGFYDSTGTKVMKGFGDSFTDKEFADLEAFVRKMSDIGER